MKMCINWKAVTALGLVGLAVAALAPNLIGAALPLLVLAACPLSMVLMMRAMSGGKGKDDAAPASEPSRSPVRETNDELARLRAEVDQFRAERHLTPDSPDRPA